MESEKSKVQLRDHDNKKKIMRNLLEINFLHSKSVIYTDIEFIKDITSVQIPRSNSFVQETY